MARRPGDARRSAPSWSRPTGRASRSSTAATSWACARSPTRVISFTNVRVPAREPDRRRGQGPEDRAHHAQRRPPLDPQRLASARPRSACEICAQWASERVQWGKPIGKHEAIAHKIADMAADTFAMESIAKPRHRDGRPRRLRHPPGGRRLPRSGTPTARWEIVDDTMQIRGGRGYETEPSLAARGEEPIGVERMMRDYRINKIFEGSSEIMHLFMAREAVDKHLQVAGAMIDPEKPARREARRRCRRSRPSTPGGTRPAGWAGAAGRATPSSAALADAPALRRAQQRGGWRAPSFHGMLVYQAEARRTSRRSCSGWSTSPTSCSPWRRRSRAPTPWAGAGSAGGRRTPPSWPTSSAAARGARSSSCSRSCGATTTSGATAPRSTSSTATTSGWRSCSTISTRVPPPRARGSRRRRATGSRGRLAAPEAQ